MLDQIEELKPDPSQTATREQKTLAKLKAVMVE